jgi:hypothetical protein
MSQVQAFFQSKAYAHFWLFIVKSAFIVGVLSTGAVLIAQTGTHQGDVGAMAAIVFIYAAAVGGIAAIVGYAVLFLLLKLRVKLPFEILATLVGAALGLVIATQSMFGVSQASESAVKHLLSILLFPALPTFLAVFFFVKFARTDIKPYFDRNI